MLRAEALSGEARARGEEVDMLKYAMDALQEEVIGKGAIERLPFASRKPAQTPPPHCEESPPD